MLEIQSIGPDSIWVKTNPAWCYHEFIRREHANRVDPRLVQNRLANWIRKAQKLGVHFPRMLWDNLFCFCPSPEWEPPRENPRVVGLLRTKGGDQSKSIGFVTQVRAERSQSGWCVSDGLPFKVGHIQDAFSKLIRFPGVSLDAIIPEAQPFAISDSLGQTSNGSSMNIAGLLAVIDAWNDHQGIDGDDSLRSVCSLVKPMNDTLVPVAGILEKIEAFQREYGIGSLVICTAATSKDYGLKKRFQRVWDVNDFESLARLLNEAGLLKPVFAKRKLTNQYVSEASLILTRLTVTCSPKVALDFSHRLNRTADMSGVESLRVKQKVNEALEDFNRHIGNFADAVRWSEKSVQILNELREFTSFQEEVEAKTRLGSAMYDAHQFQQAAAMLKELVSDDQRSPRMLSAETKVMLYNTYARILVAMGAHEWENFYRKSIGLQERFEPTSIGRTRCYLIHGLLRNDRLREAQTELAWFEENEADSYTRSFVTFYRADLYRRDQSCGIEFLQNDEFESTGRGHVLGFYYQATARQIDRDSADRVIRFKKAILAFEAEIGDYKQQNILQLFSLFLALVSDPENVAKHQADIDSYLISCQSIHLREWYKDPLQACPLNTELLLNRIPFF